jgi:Tol biopolymer transport system component/predicted Ser/Thr protein kinase
MKLSTGDKLGPFEITGLIGKGGMGEVYRGTDTRLGRPVAIKVSSREFNDRFEREAKAISALNHPNICTLYDIGPNYLVMEFVEGELLSKIIERGPLPLDKALTYAVQIVDALSAAHSKGIIHRDLKPGNIIVTRNGVKVLDFGLARLTTERMPSADADNVETVTEPITRAGAVLGTLYYMAPEQVEAKETDERSDIFSFGIVCYEMITGQRPFTGDTQAATLASLMKDSPPPMNQRQPATPRALERVVRKCLEKKPEDRWRSAHDLKPTLELIDLDAPPTNMSSASLSVPIPVQTPPKRWLWPAVAAAVVLLGAGGTYAYLNREIPVPDAIRFEIGLPGSGGLGGAAVSPDGRKLAFVARGTDGNTKLWIRSLSTSEARPLDGSEGVLGIPFWSPDSRYVAFGADTKLKKMEAAGGPAQTLTAVAAGVAGGLWTPGGKIVFGQYAPTPTNQVSASGGTATPVRGLADRLIATPSALPDGKHFVFASGDGIYIAPLEDGSKEIPRRILQDVSAVAYSPAPNSKQGYLLFVRGAATSGAGPATGTLMAQPFDPRRNELAGDAVPVTENVTVAGGFSVSQTGVLIHSRNAAVGGSNLGGTTGVLTWLDRTGKVLSTVGDLKGYTFNISLSPDGKRVATSHNGDIWVFELERGVDTRLTFEPGTEFGPFWRGDGSRIVYTTTNPYALYEKPANGAGSPELFFAPAKELGVILSSEWTPDSRFLTLSTGGAASDMWLLPAEGTAQTRKLIPLVKTQFNERGTRFPSSGKFFAYTSDESGKDEAYVRPFDPQTGTSPGGQWMISKGGGVSPHWRYDGKEMFYVAPDGAMMSVEIDMKNGFQPGVPKQLFKLPGEIRFWDVTRDGQKFLIPVPVAAADSAPYNVIVNWTSTLKK